VRRELWNVGGVRRIGIGRRRDFAGVLVTQEHVRPGRQAVVISDSALVADTTEALGVPLDGDRRLRLHAVAGMRALSFIPVRGFDALVAAQDVATGVQVGALVGRGIRRFDDSDDHLVAGDLCMGAGSSTSFAALRIEGEARYDRCDGRWDALGDPEGGVRGFTGSRVAGSSRNVVRVEERWSLRPRSPRAAFGVAGFVDAGRVRAGDAPFGADSRTAVGVGAGVLAATPARSSRLWRLDLAVPVTADARARWEVRISSAWTRRFWREPNDVALARAGAAPSTIGTSP
jgi:hypothetical protein